MTRKATTIQPLTSLAALATGLVALIGIAATASGAELQPLQGYAIVLGSRAATVHFRQQAHHKELVTTLAAADLQGPRTRRVTVLEPGQTVAVPLTPSGILALRASDAGATVVVTVVTDLSAGGRATRLAAAE